MGDQDNKTNTFESGSDRSKSASTSNELLAANRGLIKFGTKQGYRRRHPNTVLGEYAGVVNNSLENPKNSWENYLEKEHERTALPKEYISGSATQLVTQAGLTETSDKNYKKSKPKLSSLFTTGM